MWVVNYDKYSVHTMSNFEQSNSSDESSANAGQSSEQLIRIQSNQKKDSFRIELFLSNRCNYKCWYCFPGSNEGTHGWPDLELIKKNLSHLIEHYKKNVGKKDFYLHLIGGEPTIWKDFGEFTKYFKEKFNCLISMSTNGSRTLRWWEEYGHYNDIVMLSCHHERVDVPHIIAVADLLYKKGVSVDANVLMDPHAWDKCVAIVEQLKSSRKKWAINVLEIYHSTVNYNAEQKKYLSDCNKRNPSFFQLFNWKKRRFEKFNSTPTLHFNNKKKKRVLQNYLSLNGMNNFKGWQCNVGVDTIQIDKHGLIKGSCGNRLYNLNRSFNLFNHDFTDNFYPDIVPTICERKRCTCQPEINCNKKIYE